MVSNANQNAASGISDLPNNGEDEPGRRFDVTCVSFPDTQGRPAVDALLDEGWEPFAVVIGQASTTATSHERLWLRLPLTGSRDGAS